MNIGLVLAAMSAMGSAAGTGDKVPFGQSPDLQLPGVTGASGLTAADLNGNGKSDLVVVSGVNHELLVLLNRGENKFDTKTLQTREATNLALGDFNEDGHIDIATSSHSRADISILLGNGDGTFKPGPTNIVPTKKPHCHMLKAVDMNGDSHLDLLLSQSDDNVTWIFLGDGKGHFSKESSAPYATGQHPYVVATGDFNNDGYVDFATPNWFSRSISVFLNIGGHRFQRQQDINLGKPSEPTALAVGDLNGDGRSDLVVGNNGVIGLEILAGDGHGVFAREKFANLTPAEPCFGPTIADLNGDGKPDILATATKGAQTLSYWLNEGSGLFSAPQQLRCAAGANSICVADLNGDGLVDLAVGTSADTHTLIWFGRR